MERFEIRKTKREDLKDIIKIFKSWKPQDWDTENAHEYFKDFFRNKSCPHDQFFVGIIDNKIVSVIGYCPDRLNEIGVYWLGWFYTHKDYNHRGIGKSMFDFVISELKVKKACRLFVNTSSDEFYKPAMNFYQKMGFKKINVDEDFYEEGEDKIIMSKNLDE
ncbi:MAG: GNAT family N-acetyltransferase [Ignavibacteriaceae bacterium]|jgi:ribosomal protein S18 acetylase RimI-like enzyme|nr:GNAT family N-acetyltransferase [Ignavibacteriaceae bacterium]